MKDVFTMLSKAHNINEFEKLMTQAQEILSNYPSDIVEEFITYVNDFESKNIIATKNNYQGFLGYIMIRLNLK